MKFIFISIFFTINLFSNEFINISFKDLKISELLKISSKILDKNILISQNIEGNVDFIPRGNLKKSDLLNILHMVLQDKGFSLVEEKNILRVVPLIEIKKDDENIPQEKKEVKVIPLKNIDATNIIKILEEIINKKEYEKTYKKPLVSLESESNSIILMGIKEEISYITELIDELDKEKTQVYVQARIIEVNDELVNQIGLSYGIFGAKSNGNVLASFSSSLNKGSIPSFSIEGLKIPDMVSGLALGASLNLLRQKGALDIVSEPSILAVNNKESSIYVGETISIKVSSSISDGGTTRENYEREDVGLTLKVKPRISNDTKVTLEIETILEGVKTTQTISGNADTSKKRIETTAILNNGESVIIGGLIENKSEKTQQKVPVLGDVPLFGELFKNSVENSKKNNLVVIVTPYLIPKAKDITFIRNKLSELKELEDKYLEKSLLKLKEEQSKKKLNEDSNNLKNKKITVNEHEKRVKEILGY